MTPIAALRTATAVLCAAFLALTVGRCQGERAANAESTVRHEQENGDRLARHARLVRDTVAAVLKVTDTKARAIIASGKTLKYRLASTQTALDESRAVLADSLADIAEIRNTLAALSIAAQLSITEGKTYLALADSLVKAYAQERLAFQTALFASDSVVASKDRLITALSKSTQCRIIGPIPCPSRTTSFIAGGLVVAALVIKLAR